MQTRCCNPEHAISVNQPLCSGGTGEQQLAQGLYRTLLHNPEPTTRMTAVTALLADLSHWAAIATAPLDALADEHTDAHADMPDDTSADVCAALFPAVSAGVHEAASASDQAAATAASIDDSAMGDPDAGEPGGGGSGTRPGIGHRADQAMTSVFSGGEAQRSSEAQGVGLLGEESGVKSPPTAAQAAALAARRALAGAANSSSTAHPGIDYTIPFHPTILVSLERAPMER